MGIKQSLLLIDSDPKGSRVLEVGLKKAGFDVRVVSTGADGWTALAERTPDAVIVETHLPDEDGFELVQRLRAQPAWTKLPVVILTSQKSVEDKVRAWELGVEDYLAKPVYIKELTGRVQILLQRQQRERLESRRGENRARFSGQLADLSLVDLIQTIELNGKSGIIHMISQDGRRGSVYFRDGQIIDAETGRLSGLDAVHRLFGWLEGGFEVEFKPIRRKDVVNLPPQSLLAEGLRRQDEWAQLAEPLPPLPTVFEVDYLQLAERLGDIPDEVNGILRLFDGRRSLAQVIEDTELADLETLSVVSKLFGDKVIYPARRQERSTESRQSATSRLERWLSETGWREQAPGPAANEAVGVASGAEGNTTREADQGDASPTAAAAEDATTELTANVQEATLPNGHAPGEESAPTSDSSGLLADGSAPTDTDSSNSDEDTKVFSITGRDAAMAAFDQEAPTAAATPTSLRILTGEVDSTNIEPTNGADGAAELAFDEQVTNAAALDAGGEDIPATAAAGPGDSAPEGPPRRETAPYGIPSEGGEREEDAASGPVATRTLPVWQAVSPAENGGGLDEVLHDPSAKTPMVESTGPEGPEVWQMGTAATLWPGGRTRTPPTPKPETEDGQAEASSPEQEAPSAVQMDTDSLRLPLEKFPETMIGIGGTSLLAPVPEGSAEPRRTSPPPAEPPPPAPPAGAPRVDTDPLSQSEMLDELGVSSSPWRKPVAALTAGLVGGLLTFGVYRAGLLPWKPRLAEPASMGPTIKTSDPAEASRPGPERMAGPGVAEPQAPASSPGRNLDPNRKGEETPRTPPQASATAEVPKRVPQAAAPTRSATPNSAASAKVPPAFDELVARCRVANDKEKYGLVLSTCGRALMINPEAPETPEMMSMVANANLDRGHTADAVMWAKKAIALDPKAADAYVVLGGAQQVLGRNAEARAAYAKYLALAPRGRYAVDLKAVLQNLPR